jgi:DNA primase
MPHYLQRPLSILRNTPRLAAILPEAFPRQSGAGLRVVKIPTADKDPDFVVCDSPEGLLHLAQVGRRRVAQLGRGDAEAHAGRPPHLRPRSRRRTRLPPLRDAALAIRKLLEDLGLESWVKTTAARGCTWSRRSRPRPDWDTAKDFALSITRFMERLAPTMFTSRTGERNRKRKIFVDYLRNWFRRDGVAAYSPRWRAGVGVSTPVTWDEIDADIRGYAFNIHNVPDRMARQRKRPVERTTGPRAGADQGHDPRDGGEVARRKRW